MRLIHSCLMVMLVLVVAYAGGYAQVTGVKLIGTDYASLAAAVTDLNTNGVGAGGAIINVPAGYTETAPAGGYLLGSTALNASTTASNTLVIQKSGAGADPLITAFTGTGTTDGIFKIRGVDYLTIDGIDLQENPANITTTTEMEWGYALMKLNNTAPFDGCQHDIIRNCTVSLTRAYAASIGIYAYNGIATSTSQLAITATTDANSYNSFYSNTVTNCYIGIEVIGWSSAPVPYTLYDQNNQIGVGGGNTVTNFGGGTSNASGIFAQNQNNLRVDNNTVAGGGSTTGAVYGIQTGLGNFSNVEIYNNTVIDSCAATSNSTMYGIYNTMGSGTTPTVTIRKNTVKNLSYLLTAAGGMDGIYNFSGGGVLNLDSNLVYNCVKGGTSGGNLYGVISQSSFVTVNIVANRIQRLSFAGTAGTGLMYGIYHQYTTPNPSYPGTVNVTNNVVDSLYSTIATAVTGMQAHPNMTTYPAVTYNTSNTISRLGSTGGAVVGLALNIAGQTAYASGNKVYGLTSSAATGTVTGFNIGYSGTSFYLYNNFCSDLTAPASTASAAVIGIKDTGSIFSGIYFNSIYLNASSTGTGFGTAGMYIGNATASNADVRNNIIANASTPNGGKTAAIRFPSNITGNYLSTANYNDLYAGTPDTNHALMYDSVSHINAQTIAQVQAAYAPAAHDQASFTEYPAFVNVATTPYDLHITPGSATRLKGGGSAVTTPNGSITLDFDGDTRNASFPDVGADEFTGTSIDLSGPTITFTQIKTTTLSPRTLVATVTDPAGVHTSGSGLPVLYWKKNSAGVYAGVTGSSLGGGQFSFSYGGGAVTGDTIYYYLAAQDYNTNVTVVPGGGSGYSPDPPAAATPPAAPAYYVMFLPPLSGDYHVRPSGDFATLTAAVAALNSRGVSGSVRFLLDSTTYSAAETFPLKIQVTADSIPTATKTVTIKPNTGVTATIAGSYTNASNSDGLIEIYSPYIIFDGNNGDGNRDLTINNQSIGTSNTSIATWVVGYVPPGTGGTVFPANCTIQNCNIVGGRTSYPSSSTSYVYGVYEFSLGTNPGQSGVDNLVVNNNVITRCTYGVYLQGNTSAFSRNDQITNNVIGSLVDTNSVFKQGIVVGYCDNALISGNEIIGEVAGNVNGGSSMSQSLCGVLISNYATNTKIRKNKIHDWYSLTTGSGGQGIVYYASTLASNPIAAGTTEISNNMIYNIRGAGGNAAALSATATSSYAAIPAGILIAAYGGAAVQVYYNTIYLSGAYLNASGPSTSACVTIGGSPAVVYANTVDLRNNILVNSQTPTTGSTTDTTFAVVLGGSTSLNTVFANIDYNDYFSNGSNGQFGWLGGSRSSLANWQSATGKDAHSVKDSVVFVSAVDPQNLHLTGASVGDGNLIGTPISGITTDFDGQTRDQFAPYMGADEVSGTPVAPVVDGNLSDPQYTTLAAKVNTNSGFGSAIDVSKIVYYANNQTQALYVGIAGKLDVTNLNGIGIWLNLSEVTGTPAGTALGGSPGGHYMGGSGGAAFKADFEVDYMFAINPGASASNCYVDAVKLVGGRQGSYLGNCGQSGTSVSGPSGTSDFFTQNSVTFAFNNGGGANQGFEMRIPFSQLGVSQLGTVQAFAFVVSSDAYFSDVTVPGNVGGASPRSNPGYNADFSTLAGGPYHAALSPLPIQLASFTAAAIPGSSNSVRLDWTTASEVNNYGFYVQHKHASETAWTEVQNSFVAGHGTTNTPHRYTFTDNTVNGSSMSFRLRQVDLDGTVHYSDPVQVTGLTNVKETAPRVFALFQNYPNPFNPTSVIKFSVETTSRTTLVVYNLLGQKVATLFDGIAEAGQYYNVTVPGQNFASGVYIYRLESGSRSDIRKMVLLK